MKALALCCISAALLCFWGCSPETPSAEKQAAEKPLPPLTGRQALQQMYIAARAWSADIQPIRLNSILLPELKAEPGKAAAWQATFVSSTLGKARSYTYSSIESAGNLHKGVFSDIPGNWSGPSLDSKPFLMASVRVDSTDAYRTALKKAAAYARENPGKPINFLLEASPRFPDTAWRVIWGQSVGTSNFSIFVDASTGQYLQTIH
jgi:hypothetical protein